MSTTSTPKTLLGVATALLCAATTLHAQPEPPAPPKRQTFTDIKPAPGGYRTSWLGNTFGGVGGPNGQGYWVQNAADEIEVTPDGTVLAGITWDEAGRCIGLHKNGQVNRNLLKTVGNELENSAWGWGTANNTLAVDGNTIYAYTTGGYLLRFSWTPGDLESPKFQDARRVENAPKDGAVGLTAQNGRLALVWKNAVEVRDAETLKLQTRMQMPFPRDAVFAPDGSLWILVGNSVRHFGRDGRDLKRNVPSLEAPSALAFDHKKRLIVCENGARQQVLFFDVSRSKPREVASFGVRGGLRAGKPGEIAPKKLFELRGAGTDAKGNLYVAMGFATPPERKEGEPAYPFPIGAPPGGLWMRAFSPRGELLWSLYNNAFVDTFGFDPASDGATVYSRNVQYQLDLSRTEPGTEATLRGITVDPQSDDARKVSAATTLVRRLNGRRALFTIGQYAKGFGMYVFDEPNGIFARRVAEFNDPTPGDHWAWDVSDNGDVWYGDAPGNVIRRWKFQGWQNDKPIYAEPQETPWPADWNIVRRINYDERTDTLYLAGYLKGQHVETWGTIGPTLRRYDGWLRGDRKLVWSNENLPHDGNTDPNEGPLSPVGLDIAGDYIFLGQTRPTNGKQMVHIHKVSDASYVGSFWPGPEVEGHAGWLDMPYAIQAHRRANGEYLLLVEEDYRGKNLLYRWTPTN